MLRSNAVLKQIQNQEDLLDADDYVDYLNKEQKKLKRTHSSGLMKFDFRTKNTSYLSKKQLNEEKTTFKSLSDKQFVWDGIISISNAMANKYKFGSCESFEVLIQKFIPSFLKAEGFDPKNIEFYASVHANTKNPHLHWIFFEKEPTIQKSKNDDPCFRKKGKLKLENALKFSYFASKYVDNKKQMDDYYQLKNDFWTLKNTLKSEIREKEFQINLFSAEILDVLDEINETNASTFNKLSNKSKDVIMNYFEEQVDMFSFETQKQYESYKKMLDLYPDDERLQKDNQEFETFVGNKILRHIKQAKYVFDQEMKVDTWKIEQKINKHKKEADRQRYLDFRKVEREKEKHRRELEYFVKRAAFKNQQQKMFIEKTKKLNPNKHR